MRIPVGQPWQITLRSVLLASLMFCGGCQTATKSLFTVSGPGWHIQEGQALWRPRRGMPELAGDIVMASDSAGRCYIQFAKTPMSLVCAQTTPTNWLIQFPPAGMSFAGHGRPSKRFAWLYLHAALAGEPLPKSLHFETKPDGGWRLENRRSEETLDGFVAP